MVDFDTLYRRHAGEVFRFALWLGGDRQLAEDITSETFVRVWTARARLDLKTVTGYLLTIARNLYLRGKPAARNRLDLADDPADPAPGPHEIAERRGELDAVLTDLKRLAEPDRTALWLRAREQMPYEEIAAVLGITVGAARVKVHRARLRLAESRMRREGARS